MNTIAKTLCTVLFLSSYALCLGDQEPDMTWGKVPVEQLKMTTFPGDSNATAVILFDYGNVSFGGAYDLIYTHHRRIKILTKAGFDWATHEIPYYAKGKIQRITDLEGQTITMEPSGKVVTKELDDDAIFDEESGENWKRKKFTLPALAPGCIVEYRYTMKSTSPAYMPNWDFQYSEPILWSEFRLRTPAVFIYAGIVVEPLPFFIKTNDIVKEPFTGPAGTNIINMNVARYVVKDVPAIRDEPYITTLDDYKQRLMLQLSMVNWPGEQSRPILESWEKVAEELSDHPRLGKQLHGFGAVRKQTEEIVKNISDPLQRLEAIHRFISNTIVWNSRRNFLASDDLDNILENKTGNSADINFLLTLMLHDAGIDAHPVLLSTRGNGKIQNVYPIVDQFDYVIARAVINKRTFFVDATDRFRPYTLLPQRALNHVGFLLDDGKYEWVNVEPAGKGKETMLINATLTADGAIQATAEMGFSEYSASRQREQYSKNKQEAYIKDLLRTENTGVTADSFHIDRTDSLTSSFLVRAKVSAPSYGQVLNDFIYFNPFLVDRTTENPFRLEKRFFPVDFAYPLSTTYTANITLPDGYALKDIPPEINLTLPSKGGSYRRVAQVDGNKVTVFERFDINQVVFNPPQYAGLRGFYERIVAAENEQLIIQKKPAPAPPPPAPIQKKPKGKK